MAVFFGNELIIVPFIWKDNKGQVAFGEIREMSHPHMYEVIIEDKPIKYFDTLDEAKNFVQNHIQEYAEEAE